MNEPPSSHHASPLVAGLTGLVVFPDKKHVPYAEIVVKALEEVLSSWSKAGFTIEPVRLSESMASLQNYHGRIKELAAKSVVGLVVLDGLRPNVVYELGLLEAHGIPTLAVATANATVAARAFYECFDDLETVSGLTPKRWESLKNPPLDVAKHLSDIAGAHIVHAPNPIGDYAGFSKKVRIALDALAPLVTQLPKLKEQRNQMMVLAETASKRGNWEDARSIWFEIVRVWPGDHDARFNLACALTKLDRDKEALAEFKQVSPETFTARRRARLFAEISECHMALEDPDAALETANDAISADDAYALGHFCRAWALSAKAEYKIALSALDRAVDLYPEFCSSWRLKAICHGMLKEYKPGISAIRKGLEIHPESADFLAVLSELQIDDKDFDGLLETAREAIRQKVTDRNTFAYVLSWLEGDDVDNPEATVEIGEYVVQNTTSIENAPDHAVWHDMAHAFEALHDMEKAIFAHRKCVDLKPDIGSANHCLAVAFLKKPDPELALAYARKAFDLGPKGKFTATTYAIAIALAGNGPKAIEVLDSIDPENRLPEYFLLGKIFATSRTNGAEAAGPLLLELVENEGAELLQEFAVPLKLLGIDVESQGADKGISKS